ncbi:MAG: hypothetical protein L3J91_03700 [Thermoplasmata archaeon]|nr:hypothetical protein [Thermoplasmata archaeon]
MVHVKDEGSQFDAPLDMVWKYVQNGEQHNATHHSRSFSMKPLTESAMELSWEMEMDGKWHKIKTRTTVLPPVGLAIEMLEGPMAGSKFFNIYHAAGPKTGITVIGEFASKTIPESHLEPAVHAFLEQVFNEDNAAIKSMEKAK